MLESKLQIKEGQTVAAVHAPYALPLNAKSAAADSADVVLLFVANLAELKERVGILTEAGRRGATLWLAYPKAKQLGTDLNRDIIHDLMPAYGLDAVRQVAIDDAWSALRFKTLAP